MNKSILILFLMLSVNFFITPTLLISQMLQKGATKAKNTIQLRNSKKQTSKFLNEYKIDSILNIYGKEIESNSVKFKIDKNILISILYSLSDLNVDLTKISQIEMNNNSEAIDLYLNNSKKYQELMDLYINQVKLRNQQVDRINAKNKEREQYYNDQLHGKEYNPYQQVETNAFPEGAGIDPNTGMYTIGFSASEAQYPEMKLPEKLVYPTLPTMNSELQKSYTYESGFMVLSRKFSNYLTNYYGDYEKAITSLIYSEGWYFSKDFNKKEAVIILDNAEYIKIYIESNN